MSEHLRTRQMLVRILLCTLYTTCFGPDQCPSSILKINSILIPLILFLNTDLNILAFYTTMCFRLTVTTAFALIYI
jgi:hypothetical protein